MAIQSVHDHSANHQADVEEADVCSICLDTLDPQIADVALQVVGHNRQGVFSRGLGEPIVHSFHKGCVE